MVTSAALVILLSAFNGIEKMVENLYSDFDTDLTIRPTPNKTFLDQQLDFDQLKKWPEITHFFPVIEEVVVLKHEKKWVNANMIAVPESFLKVARVDQHMVDGFPLLSENGQPLALIGATLLDKLNGFIPTTGFETLQLYAPKRSMKMSLGKNPFSTQMIKVSGRLNYNREVNAEYIVVPFDIGRDLFDYSHEFSALYIDIPKTVDAEKIKEKLQTLYGASVQVKTSYEKNELIYQTSKSEKIIVVIILLFIFVIAAFTLVAAVTMLYIEKKENLITMRAFGADDSFVFRIFFLEGLMIAFKGIFFGLLIGYAICSAQIFGELLTMPNSGGEPFPMRVSISDGILILSMVSILAILASYLPAKFLIRSKQVN